MYEQSEKSQWHTESLLGNDKFDDGVPEQYLRETSFFANLPEQESACFQNVAQPRSYKKGKILYIEEEPAEFFYILCSGWIKLFHTLPEGDEIVVDMLTNGDMMGEISICDNGRHTSSAQVIEDVQLLSIPSRLMKEQIRSHPALALSIISSMTRHHRHHYGEVALNAMQSAPQRIGRFLLKRCPRDKTEGIIFTLPYEKTLIAYTLGMKGATFSRALNILREKTNIRINGTRVEIDSIEQLIKFVYGVPSSPKLSHSNSLFSKRVMQEDLSPLQECLA